MGTSLGGSSGGGGGMMKTVQRVIRAASGSRGSFQEPFTTSGPTYKPSSPNNGFNNLSFSSSHRYSPFNSLNHLNRTDSSSPISEQEFDDYVFCSVPSTNEVHHALSSLHHVLDPQTSSDETVLELDWMEPPTSMLQHHGSQNVYDAFRLLQTEPSVKRMVMALSSDKYVWEAIMNNEAVLEIRNSIKEVNDDVESSSDESISVPNVLKWIFINTKAKAMEIVEKTAEIVNMLFQSSGNEYNGEEDDAAMEPYEKKLRSSFMVTIMILLIIVTTRTCRSC